MRVMLDDQTCPTTATTIGEAVAAAADQAEKDGRLVVEIRVDGTPLTDEDLQSSDRLQTIADEVQLITTTIGTLLRDTFLHAAEALVDADATQRSAAELVQAGQTAEGMRALLGALETWGGIRDAVVKGLALAEVSPDDVVIGEQRLPDAITGLQDRLGALKSAMVAEDVSATCDCLLYDLPQSIREWSTILAGLAQQFDDAS